jgi:replicative DNA helicase
MPVKISSPSAEKAALRGLCSKDKKLAGALLSQIDESYFRWEDSQEIFGAIRKHMSDTGTTPTFRLLVEDPALSEEARDYFRDSQAVITTLEDVDKTVSILHEYRQARMMAELAANINDKMQGSRIDITALLEEAATSINIARSKRSTEDSFLHYGVGNNATAEVDDLLFGDHSEAIIPTGLPEFDDISGGFGRGSVVLMGAPSGCGKSLVAGAVAINMATAGYKVLMVPLEMSKREMNARNIANVTKTNLSKLLLQRLATGERELVRKRYLKWVRRVKDRGGRLTVFKPKGDLTIEEIMASTSAYSSDVKIIDYISLLKGTDGEDMWRKLSAVARYCKIHAEAENCVVILLVQVDEDGKVRYSRGVAEHANNALIWSNKKEVKETGLMRVEQIKSRNSMAFPFTLQQVQEFMRLESAPQSESLGPVTETAKPVPNLAADEK